MLKNILIIDSGVGAISIANEINKLVNANLIIYIDNNNAPLGEKNTEQLKIIVTNIINKVLKQYKIDMVVLACNTLTVAVIDYLRMSYHIQIVGTEPNIKVSSYPAVVLCTTYTYNNCKIINNSMLDRIALPKLATLIDNNLGNLKKCEDYIKEYLPLLKKYKSISLGCTHYTFIKDILTKYLPNVVIFENKYGVAKRVANLIGCTNDTINGFKKLILSKCDNNFKNNLKKFIE